MEGWIFLIGSWSILGVFVWTFIKAAWEEDDE